jgi:spore coat polysaccharide biosynthesis protein SpsF
LVLAILQARMSSTRLPGKVLMPLVGAPMILRQIERLRRAQALTRIVVATSNEPADEAIAQVCEAHAVNYFRGDLLDVLDRFHVLLTALGEPEHFLRLTADCPLADPQLIDQCVAEHLASGADYTHNTPGWTYPKGLDVEVCRSSALFAAWREATEPYEREHVTPFIYGRPERFRLHRVRRDPPWPYRWTVDTLEDFAFVESVYQALYPQKPDFTTADVLAWQERHPDRVLLNADWRPA